MTPEVLSVWVLALLHSLSPPELADRPTYPTATETRQERAARLEEIAEDIAEVAALEEPGVFGTPRRSAAYLVALAWEESRFARDVDLGPCDPERVAARGCDDGRARTMWQLHRLEAWPPRQEAARVALRRAQGSFMVCARQPFAFRLAAYASGNCHGGHEKSRIRVTLAERLAAR